MEELHGVEPADACWCMAPEGRAEEFPGRASDVAVNLAARLVGGRRASLLLPSRENDILRMAAASGISTSVARSVRVRLGDPFAGVVARERRPMMVNGVKPSPGRRRRGYLTGAFISVPVPLGDGGCGVLNVADPRGPDGFQPDDLRALQMLSEQVTRSLEYQGVKSRLETLERNERRLRKQVIETQEAERSRIARDLHDEAGHALTAAVLHLDVELAARAQDIAAVNTLNRARQELVECSRALHTIAFNLRPRILEDFGLHAALRSLARQTMEKARFQVNVEIFGKEWALTEMEELAILRVVQEALTNAHKHARPTRVDVQLFFDNRCLTVHIEDDGIGLPIHRPLQQATDGRVSMGISGMRERIELLDGTFWIGPGRAGGTLVSVMLPH